MTATSDARSVRRVVSPGLRVLAIAGLTGCASGRGDGPSDAAPIPDAITVDAAPIVDGAPDARPPHDAARLVDAAAPVDAGPTVLLDEPFDVASGAFAVTTVCGGNPPVWSNSGGRAHASEPGGTGISRLTSPRLIVPSGASHVLLELSHAYVTEDGYDGAQLYVAVDDGAPALVTVFDAGGYTGGVHTNPADCSVTGSATNQFPGWSGSQALTTAQVDLATGGLGVAAGHAFVVILQMSSDNSQSGSGWDVDRVRVTSR